jgi:nucleoside 2-deoxyribosyltransferase
MATTYLCGGIFGLDDAQAIDWRELAKQELKTETLDPMRRDYRGKQDDHVDKIVEQDLEDIKKSDFLIVNATIPSWGTAMEIPYAYAMGKKVVAFTGEGRVSPWLRYHCNGGIVRTIEEAIVLINQGVEEKEKDFVLE